MKRIGSQSTRNKSRCLLSSSRLEDYQPSYRTVLSGSRQRIEEMKRLEAMCRYRKWNDEVFEPIQRRILRRLEEGTQSLPRSKSQRTHVPKISVPDTSASDSADARLSPQMWTRDKYDSTIEGLQHRVSTATGHGNQLSVEVSGAPYQDHYNFASKYAAFADSEFPRGRRTITLPRFYRRNPILSTTV
jgi:hypothetical protein